MYLIKSDSQLHLIKCLAKKYIENKAKFYNIFLKPDQVFSLNKKIG